ncbi:hypothetical protein JOF41_002512 [Saccharothrix coeruleofusca]|uniref:hypothetical protein n=1 Tax=Saccharothrix coeruleofusca TaxID=33919 RepID=UPI001AE57AC4|nr:hypothetical protein [Saccharothrix coeruleofusca]MBP2336334.1 hypothetical protein [Saccharothrix coeruleofusca]
MAITPTRGPLRSARCGAVGATSGLLAALVHTGAAGQPPPAPQVVVFTAGVAWLALPFADRRRGPGAILAVVGLVQLTAHLSLSLLSHPHRLVPTPAMALGHLVATLLVVAVLTGAETAVFRLAAALAAALPRRLAPPPATAALRIPIAAHPLPPVRDVLRRRAAPRRGPPAHS